MPDFRKIGELASRPKGFEAAMLSDPEKQQLCETLLGEFGVTNIKRVTDEGEMIHSCCLPYDLHAHGDAKASASLNYRKLTYHCHVCGGGGLLWFIATCRGESTEQARKWIGKQTGTGAEEQTLVSLLQYFEALYNPETKRPEPIPKLNPAVLDPWMAIHPYVTDPPPDGRGIPVETAMHFCVGYDPAARIRVGDVFLTSERIVMPLFWKGDLVGWQSRRIWDDRTEKYHSSPGLPKGSTIYNYDARRPAVVVESMMSVLRQWRRCPVIESTMGASVTDTQIRLLSHHERVILFYDNDDAGWKATEDVGVKLTAYSDVRVVPNPWAADPGDMTEDQFGDLLAQAIPFSVWRKPDPKSIKPWGEAA